MKLHKNQAGFSTIEALLILVVIVVIGGAGYFIYHAQKTINKTPSVMNKATQSTTTTTTAADSMTIKEWGVSVNFSGADKVTYTPPESRPGDYGLSNNAQGIDLFLKPSVTSSADCQDLGLSLYRDTSPIRALTDSKTVGTYSYVITGTPAACTDSSVNALRQQITGDELGSGKYTIAALN